MKKTNRGFTLIELLVVIAIIGILSAVVLASLNTARGKARDASAQSSFSTARSAAEIYYSNNTNSYDNLCPAISSGIPTLPAATAVNYEFSRALSSARTANGGFVTCLEKADNTGYTTSITLTSSGVPTNADTYCIDNKGNASAVAAAPANATVDCIGGTL
jgi:general secretion pathway protein G